ncbi:hypothetical protein PT300_03260 [Enterobacteriaceae bacterium ESL0689]|nr:hypothetical protein [Enterobacteriaceae bacterium ESL0689]
MTIAQQLEQKGIQKGIQLGRLEGLNEGRLEGRHEGRLEGRHEGKLEGKLEVARTMLKNGIDRNTVIKMTGLTEDELTQIRH